eukprot:765009-Hanusia_phi.AAC.1
MDDDEEESARIMDCSDEYDANSDTDSEDNDNPNLKAFDIIERKVMVEHESTRKVYASKIRRMEQILRSIYGKVVGEDGKLILPLSWKSIKLLFGHLATDARDARRGKKKQSVAQGDQAEGGEEVEDPDVSGYHAQKPTLSLSTLQGYKSALKAYYSDHNVAFRARGLKDSKGGRTLNERLNTLIEGYARVVTEKRTAGIMRMKEGRNSLTVQGYMDICKAVINLGKENKKQEQGNTCLFGFAATTLMWNCCSSSEILDCIHLQHMDWSNDCLKLTVLKSKKDQAGTGTDFSSPRIRHIFPAPLQPSTCPILAMALYTFTQHRYQETTKLFPGTGQKQRFCQLLQRIITGKGMNEADWEAISSNSFRTGSMTYLLGMPGGPSANSVHLRAAWSPSTTQDRCITGEEGNDQFCGRILAGNNLKKESFDLLTPHFTKAALTKLHAAGLHRFIDGYATFPDSFKRCIPVFLANILYHLDTIKSWFPARHCIWGAPLFAAFGSDTMQQLEDFRKEVILCHGYCEDCGMNCTGVCTEIENISQIRSLKESIARLQQTHEQNINSLKESLNELRYSLPQEICKALMERIGVNEANPVVRQDIEALKLDFAKMVDERLAGLGRSSADVNDTGGQASSSAFVDGNEQATGEGVRDQVFMWDGKLHPVPRDFEFPQKIDCKNMWQRWHVGQVNITQEGAAVQQIGPLKILDSKDLIKSNMRKNLCKARLVMAEVEKIARATGLLKDGECVNHSNYSLIFDAAYKELIRQRYGEAAWQRKNKRYNELSYTTLYKKLCRKETGRRVRACSAAQTNIAGHPQIQAAAWITVIDRTATRLPGSLLH